MSVSRSVDHRTITRCLYPDGRISLLNRYFRDGGAREYILRCRNPGKKGGDWRAGMPYYILMGGKKERSQREKESTKW